MKYLNQIINTFGYGHFHRELKGFVRLKKLEALQAVMSS